MNKQNREFQAFLGHIIDLYKILNFKFSVPHSYTKFRAIKSLRNKTESDTLIETGTYLGVTTNRCGSIFKQVYTIELDKSLAEKAKLFLLPKKHIKVVQGDVLESLPKILELDDISNTIIFLDAHFSGVDTACGDLPEPAIEELEIIARYKHKVKGILIDDFRLFGKEPGFPKKSSLFSAIENLFPEYEMTVYLDQVVITQRQL